MSEETKCECQYCGGHIAFTPAQAGQSAICPHCSKETVLNPPAPQSPKFFIWQNEQQEGPFSQEAIQTMISTGQVTGDTLLCPEDGGLDWTPAKELFLQDSTPENLVAIAGATENPQAAAESLVEIKINQFHSFFYQPPQTGDIATLEIRLLSGTELKIKAIRLFNESVLHAIAGKRAEAAHGHKGVSTGLGSIGSLEWVLGASLVIGAVEGVLSSGAAKAGTNSLIEALRMEKSLRESVFLLPVGVIQNIEHPMSGIWRVAGESKFQIPNQSPSAHKSAMTHDGDDFLTVQTDDGAVRSIRWSAVESYAYQKPNVTG